MPIPDSVAREFDVVAVAGKRKTCDTEPLAPTSLIVRGSGVVVGLLLSLTAVSMRFIVTVAVPSLRIVAATMISFVMLSRVTTVVIVSGLYVTRLERFATLSSAKA